MNSRKYHGFISEDFVGQIASQSLGPCKATIDALLVPIHINRCSQTALGLGLTLKRHSCEGMALTVLKRFHLGLAGNHQLDQFESAEWESQ